MKIFKSKEYKKALSELGLINELEESMKVLSMEELSNKTTEFKERIERNYKVDSLRIEAFAVAREATRRILKKRPFDVQILGGLILDYGSVAEMKTGEGKTIASIAPVYFNALFGEGVIVSTVNEYLTERDAEETAQVHNFLGLTVGVNKGDLQPDEKRLAYYSDITYSLHSEIGFDYLRDNMVKKIADKVQRGFNYALIDEVDSILIDEARTPLIVTGGQESSSQVYVAADKFVKSLKKDDYEVDMESNSARLLDTGVSKSQNFFGVKNIYDFANSDLVHRIQNALRANKIMFKDATYIVDEGKILIVDSFTGRVMEGRSFSDGVHQAIQAKEDVEIEPETVTMATVTYQNLFRMFSKLSGMSGTAKTEEDEFLEIYNMRVNEIPTNKPILRVDKQDVVYNSFSAKYKAMVKEITERYEKGQPVLVGTEDVSESEKISLLLKKAHIPHTVLNAKQNLTEAEVIAHAGEYKSITIATNMAGRGTDIKPSQKSISVGGLFVLGTNKAESRRIDNQLKGRSGRQGDIGDSQFYLSLDDKLISRFSNQPKLKKLFESLGDEAIKSKQVAKALERAQTKIEGLNFDSRKNVLQYDDVIRQQRDLIYAQRDIIIGNDDLDIVVKRMISSVVKDFIYDKSIGSVKKKDGSIHVQKMSEIANLVWFQIADQELKIEEIKGKTLPETKEIITKKLLDAYEELKQNIVDNFAEDTMHDLEREIIISTFDKNWQVHIDKMTKLKTTSSMSSYAQKNPFQVYIEEGTKLFYQLLQNISHNTIKLVMQNTYALKREVPIASNVLADK
ncbi:MAG: preprotein translocase subunit SecA [Mycoplasmataceae bacterium]|nr:preprotein translocase subunit SecA [Mycoplasmataceae bacterium]